MATNIKPLLSHENGTELCRVREEGAVKGFRKECLKEDLTERDRTLLTCSRCQGILREACNSNSGEQFCLCCKKEQEQTHPNLQVRNTVLLLKSLCPIHQRGCNWVGNVGDCEKHLEVCGYVHEKCKLGCGVVLSRDELIIHTKEACLQPASLTHIIMLDTEGEIATIERDCIAARFIRDGGIELGITFERS